jgi:uncharacterized membrane protein YfcA
MLSPKTQALEYSNLSLSLRNGVSKKWKLSTANGATRAHKTVFASIAMGGKYHSYFAVWAGSTLGMYLADVIAIVCGRILGKHLPERVIKYGSAAIFIGAGLFTLYEAFQH